jgi:hypothetical protein
VSNDTIFHDECHFHDLAGKKQEKIAKGLDKMRSKGKKMGQNHMI